MIQIEPGATGPGTIGGCFFLFFMPQSWRNPDEGNMKLGETV
jgi:hypothetical protein